MKGGNIRKFLGDRSVYDLYLWQARDAKYLASNPGDPDAVYRHGRVDLWDKVERKRLSGARRPLRMRLEAYMAQHPKMEIYSGQDRIVATTATNGGDAGAASRQGQVAAGRRVVVHGTDGAVIGTGPVLNAHPKGKAVDRALAVGSSGQAGYASGYSAIPTAANQEKDSNEPDNSEELFESQLQQAMDEISAAVDCRNTVDISPVQDFNPMVEITCYTEDMLQRLLSSPTQGITEALLERVDRSPDPGELPDTRQPIKWQREAALSLAKETMPSASREGLLPVTATVRRERLLSVAAEDSLERPFQRKEDMGEVDCRERPRQVTVPASQEGATTVREAGAPSTAKRKTPLQVRAPGEENKASRQKPLTRASGQVAVASRKRPLTRAASEVTVESTTCRHRPLRATRANVSRGKSLQSPAAATKVDSTSRARPSEATESELSCRPFKKRWQP